MQLKKAMNFICLSAILTMSILLSACGLRNTPEPVRDGAESGSERETADAENQAATGNTGFGESGTVAVAEFYYMRMPKNVIGTPFVHYALDDEYLYYTDTVSGGEDTGYLNCVVRKRISDGQTEEDYIVSERKVEDVQDQILLIDTEGCCYLLFAQGRTMQDMFWSEHDEETFDGDVAEEDVTYFLEKYGTEGDLIWQREFTPDKFQYTGRDLTRGVVTGDGRIFLYTNTYGENNMVFAFSAQGELEETYIPELESLDGVAAGKGGRAYAYCVTGKEPVFQELGGEGKAYVSPRRPRQVYSGAEYGIYMDDGKGMWRYMPETGETELLWGWEDEYVQVNGNYVYDIFQGDGSCMLLSMEPMRYDIGMHAPKQTLIFTTVAPADSRDYPGKQPLTLAVSSKDEQVDTMVKLYNRHSKEYIVKIVEKSQWSLETELLRREGPDLVNINDYYGESLAELGAFEELGPYYESSRTTAEEDLLEAVLRCCTIRGRKVGVVPSFYLGTLLAKETWCTQEEWDVWNFLEMVRENRMFRNQSPYYIFRYGMGIQYGEYFIDWEKKECYFDSEEFRHFLEACMACESYEDDGSDPYLDGFGDRQGEDGWRFVEGKRIGRIWDILSEPLPPVIEGDPEYAAKLVGFPGWSGGEYELKATGMFAISSASENKEGAWDFLEYLLSEEYQGLLDASFPVRKENFEDSLNVLYDIQDSEIFSDDAEEPSEYGSREENIARVWEMVNAAVFNNWSGKVNPVQNILEEETDMYFAGDATLDETVDKIQNRMQLYLDEH